MSAARPSRSPPTRSISARRCSKSSLTLIENGRLYYRGWDAAQLAQGSPLERVAQLLWQCDERPFDAKNLPSMSTALRQAWLAAATLAPVDRCLLLLPAAARWDHPSWVEDRNAMIETGVRILRLLTAAVTAEPVSPLPVHEQLAAAWHVPADRAPLIRAALVLSADHEFNASAFAARVVASTGANLHGSTIAGLAAINGPRHGGLTRRVSALFDELQGRRRSRRRARPTGERRPRPAGLRPSALSGRRHSRRDALCDAARDHARRPGTRLRRRSRHRRASV